MFPDPFSFTLAGYNGGSAFNMARVSQTSTGGKNPSTTTTYKSVVDDLVYMTITHTVGKDGRIRSLIQVELRKIVTNPLDSTKQDYDSVIVSKQYNRPGYGFSLTDVTNLTTALNAWESASSYANTTKLFNRES